MENIEPNRELKNSEKVPAIFGHIVKNYFSVTGAILDKTVEEDFLQRHKLKKFEVAVAENLERGSIKKDQAELLLSKKSFIEEYNNFLINFENAVQMGKLEEKREELKKIMDKILNKIEDQ